MSTWVHALAGLGLGSCMADPYSLGTPCPTGAAGVGAVLDLSSASLLCGAGQGMPLSSCSWLSPLRGCSYEGSVAQQSRACAVEQPCLGSHPAPDRYFISPSYFPPHVGIIITPTSSDG